MLSSELRKLSVSASDIGHCLLCGGVDGNCSCVPPLDSVLPDAKRWALSDVRKSKACEGAGQDRASAYFLCFRSRHVVRVDSDCDVVRCECGNLLRYTHIPVIPEPDYSLLDVSPLPRRALRKPRI